MKPDPGDPVPPTGAIGGSPEPRQRFVARLAEAQARSHWRFLLAALLLSALALPLVLRLSLDSSWVALLPSDKPSVQDLERTRDRIAGLNQLTVVVLSEDTEALQRFAGDLVPRLSSLKGERVASVEWNIAEFENFVRRHRHLYADLESLYEIRDELQLRLDHERLKLNPMYVNLEDDPEPPEALFERLEAQSERARTKLRKFPGGYYIHPDGNLLAVFVRTDVKGGDQAGGNQLIQAVLNEVAQLSPEGYATDMRVELAGGLMHARDEHEAIRGELTLATSLTLVLVLLVVQLFFRRWRAIPVLGSAVLVPVLLTFAFAELTVDSLNTSTAFLGSIVLGNGVNPNIIWLARYFEQRRAGLSVRAAIEAAHLGTWAATLTASLAAGLAYASLILTDFRGFKDFGIIGGCGMLLCWLGAYLLLPAVVTLSERMRPLRFQSGDADSNFYGKLFFSLVRRAPRTVIVASALLSLASVLLVHRAVLADPLEYDFRKLRSVREDSTQVSRLNKRIGQFMSSSKSGNAIALLSDSHEDAETLRRSLTEARSTGTADFGRVRSLQALLPEEQDEKLTLLPEIRELLLDARKFADESQKAKIDTHLPPEQLGPLKLADLPASVARIYTERDGTRGRIVFVEKLSGTGAPSIWDGEYLVRWARALRALPLAEGHRPALAGRAPVFADMVEVVFQDGPRAVAASLLATTLLLLLTFRRLRDRLATLLALLLGILWMAGTMALAGMKLNFLNFVAFPITFGNGADYGVNVVRRVSLEEGTGQDARPADRRREAIRVAVQQSGGAVVLCSLTTIIGYSSLYVSANQALNSFGAAMAISELTCLCSAVLTIPAWLWLRASRDADQGNSAPSPPPSAMGNPGMPGT